MKKISLSLFVLVCILLADTACAQVYTTQAAQVSFFSAARLENIQATSKKCGVVLNTATNEILVKLTITTFEFKNGLMQEHFNETYMETAKYPTAQFSGKINEAINYKVKGAYPASVTGALTIHGVTMERTIPGTVTVSATGVGFSSHFIVAVADHKIHIPNDKISNISQNIQVSIQADCAPYVKK